MLSFEALAESAFRQHADQSMDTAVLNSLAFNDPKKLDKERKKLSKRNRPHRSGDDLKAGMGQ